MVNKRLLRLKHERRDLGFMTAYVVKDDPRLGEWSLRVESPESAQEYLDHLVEGSSMSLDMVTREGDRLNGEAFVASVSDALDAATVVLLCGSGPLQND